MTIELTSREDEFQSLLETIYDAIDVSPLSRKIKIKAWDHFKTLGLPKRKNENFRYVPLRKLFEKQYSAPKSFEIDKASINQHILPECQDSLIVLVNGSYSKELSNVTGLSSRIVITSLNEAVTTYGAFLTNHFTKTLKEESDAFAVLNSALNEEGVFVYLPPKTIAEKPIQILHLIDSKNKALILNPRLQVFVSSLSEAEFVITQGVISGDNCFINHVSDFAIEEDSHVRYNQVLSETPDSVWHFDATRAILKKNSTFHAFAVTKGSTTVRTDYKVTIIGENAESSLNGLWMLQGTHEFHTNVLIDHQAFGCRSRQLFKGVLDDFSKSSFEGKILVRQAAQKTDAFQLNSNLMLNDYTNAYSKPNLEIFADDVKASHGATFGQLDSEQLFCLRSRGINEIEAKNLLIFGFCKEVIDLITLPSIQKMLTEQAKQYRKGD